MSLPIFDACGNELKENLRVLVKLEDSFVIAKIIKIERGGIINPHDKGGMTMPATVHMLAEISCAVPPGKAIASMFALREDKKAPAVASASSS